MTRKPNTECHVCGAPIYRRPAQLKKNPVRYCPAHRYTGASTFAKKKIADEYAAYIVRWRRGEETGMKGTTAISSHIRRYLREKFDNACCKCGWAEVHPTTGNVPVEVNHIDGDHTNNIEENLELICPNCHSLTPTYRNLNNGNGRPR
jgi:hypothetical protein